MSHSSSWTIRPLLFLLKLAKDERSVRSRASNCSLTFSNINCFPLTPSTSATQGNLLAPFHGKGISITMEGVWLVKPPPKGNSANERRYLNSRVPLTIDPLWFNLTTKIPITKHHIFQLDQCYVQTPENRQKDPWGSSTDGTRLHREKRKG